MRAKVGIIIPFKKIDSNVRKGISKILEMDFKDYEIILLPDTNIDENFPKTRIIPTGNVVPALKRDMAMFSEKYELFASIDSDAYPDKQWLSNAVRLFDDNSVCAVGGPNLTPPEAGILEKSAVDIVYSMLGLSTAYYLKKYKNGLSEVKELASSNLIIRRSDFIKTKGYDTKRPTGEDSILCFNLLKTGKKIIYSPEVRVFHHRRRLFMPHLKRVFLQASDKVAILLSSSGIGKLVYFIPAVFVLFLVIGSALSFFSKTIFEWFIGILLAYFAIVFLDSLRTKSPIRILLFMAGLPLTHIAYGLGYVWGMLCKSGKY